MADWISLPDEILCIICKNVDTVIDYLQFSVVCKSWNFVAKCLCGFPVPYPRLMLPPKTKINSTKTSQYWYSMVGLANGGKRFENKLYEIDINPNILHEYPCVGSAGNWLVLLDTKNHKKKDRSKKKHRVCIFNLFSKRRINLPPQSTLSGIDNYSWNDDSYKVIEKVVLTSISCSNDSIIDCIAIAIYGHGYIALARPGDISWTRVGEIYDENWYTEDAIIIKNKLYAIDKYAKLFIYNIDKDSLQVTLVFRHDNRKLQYSFDDHYLVEWMGELLLIGRCGGGDSFKVAKQSFDAVYEWKWIEDLGNHSLFLGFNSTSLAVSASECSSHKMNCIYHSSRYVRYGTGEPQIVIEVFDLKEQRTKNLSTGRTMAHPTSAPIWIVSNSTRSQARIKYA